MEMPLDISATVAVFIRCLGVLSILPIGQGAVSHLTRVSFSLLIALIVQGTIPVQSFNLFGLVGEFLIGIVIAMPAAMVLECATIWGELLDWGRGQTMANLLDPSTQRSIAPTAMLLNWAVWTYIILAGGLELILGGLAESYRVVAVFGFDVSALPGIGMGLLTLVGQQLSGAFGIFLPLACVYFLVDFCVGVVSKLLPQVSLTHESFITKSSLALIFLIVVSQMQLHSSLPALISPRLAILTNVGW